MCGGGFSGCSNGNCQCKDVLIECGTCGGEWPDRCVSCGGRGRVALTACVFEMIRPDEWAVLDAAAYADMGFLPVSGGWLDQASTGLEAIRLVRFELNRLRESRR